jgi:hypothetical protein
MNGCSGTAHISNAAGLHLCERLHDTRIVSSAQIAARGDWLLRRYDAGTDPQILGKILLDLNRLPFNSACISMCRSGTRSKRDSSSCGMRLVDMRHGEHECVSGLDKTGRLRTSKIDS